MSLEQALAANTAALEALTAVMAGAKVNTPAAASSGTTGTKGTPVVTGPSKDPKPGKAGKQAATAAAPETEAGYGGVEVSAADLTEAIVKTVAATSRDAVVDLLQTKFGVKAGKEITDSDKRAEVIAALDELVANESVG